MCYAEQMKWLLLIVSTCLISAGFSAALAAPYLPMFADVLWLATAVFLVLGIAVLLRRLRLLYLFMVIPLAALLAHGVIGRVWPPGAPTNSAVDTSGPPDPNRPQLLPVAISRGPDGIKGHRLELPTGWQVNIFAEGLGKARLLELAADGTLLVSVPDQGRIVALPDQDRDGVADRQVIYADGLPSVHGLARVGQQLWAAETGRLLRLPDVDGDLRADAVIEQSRDLPGRGGHWTRSLAVAADGRLFLSAGSSCNACLEEDPRRATVMTFSAASDSGRIHAHGLRNSVGLAIHPVTKALWASDNGRDLLGDDLPPDEINLIEPGKDYGWPHCYGQRIADPELGTPQRCADTQPAAVELQAHSAPLGITFVRAARFDYPADYLLLVAYHGSWNRSVPTGYKLVAIPFTAGRPSGAPFDLVRGWLDGAGEVWGRPVAPLLGADGALYVTDDLQGIVYRFWKDRPPE